MWNGCSSGADHMLGMMQKGAPGSGSTRVEGDGKDLSLRRRQLRLPALMGHAQLQKADGPLLF